jgi:hypothetical protein
MVEGLNGIRFSDAQGNPRAQAGTVAALHHFRRLKAGGKVAYQDGTGAGVKSDGHEA